MTSKELRMHAAWLERFALGDIDCQDNYNEAMQLSSHLLTQADSMDASRFFVANADSAKNTALLLFAESLRKMVTFYTRQNRHGHIHPIDAVTIVMRDLAEAATHAARGERWVDTGVWESATIPTNNT